MACYDHAVSVYGASDHDADHEFSSDAGSGFTLENYKEFFPAQFISG